MSTPVDNFLVDAILNAVVDSSSQPRISHHMHEHDILTQVLHLMKTYS